MSCINGLIVNTFCLANSTRTPIQLPQDLLYTDIGVPMNPAKLEDIQKILDYIPDKHKDYYLDIISKTKDILRGKNQAIGNMFSP
ncbi:hypothetical protein QTP88_006581 [Uroleucon formosanum]